MKKLPVIQPTQEAEFTFDSLADAIRPIYLDNNATTQVDEEGVSAMIKMMGIDYGNPSTVHSLGISARTSVEEARVSVANFIGCTPEEVVFTSGGTESINTVINSVIATQYPRCHFITCVAEHGATLNKLKVVEDMLSPRKYDVTYLGVDSYGQINLFKLEELLNERKTDTALVSLMAANNETGVRTIGLTNAVELAHKYGALFHIDAVQVAGKEPLKPFIDTDTDFLTISGHKFHAPKGIGALYVRRGTVFAPLILGGYQENDRRAGTENTPAIVALGVVAKKMPVMNTDKYRLMHDRFVTLLSEKIPSCIINGNVSEMFGVIGTINVGFRYVHREAMVVALSRAGVYASVGSACAKGIEPSHVLKAMGVPAEYLHGSVRFSFSKNTTLKELERAADIISKVYDSIRKLSLGIIS